MRGMIHPRPASQVARDGAAVILRSPRSRGDAAHVTEVPSPTPVRHPLLGKTTVTLGVMLLVLAVPYAHPRLR